MAFFKNGAGNIFFLTFVAHFQCKIILWLRRYSGAIHILITKTTTLSPRKVLSNLAFYAFFAFAVLIFF